MQVSTQDFKRQRKENGGGVETQQLKVKGQVLTLPFFSFMSIKQLVLFN
jgi:hypothetical protein